MKRDIDKAIVQLGKNIKRIRKRRGLSQMRLAEKADLHCTYISQIECGIRPNVSLRTVVKIAHALGLSVDGLMYC